MIHWRKHLTSWLFLALLVPFLALAGVAVYSSVDAAAGSQAGLPQQNPCSKFHARELPAESGPYCPLTSVPPRADGRLGAN